MDTHNPKEQPSSGAPMDQVREILFGAQLKDMEVRFKRQEERFLREIHEVKDSLKTRLDSLENFMKSEVASLLERLKSEQEEREAAQKAEQRDRAEALAAEQRERQEALRAEERERQSAQQAEERERQEAMARLGGEAAALAETFERKLSKLANTVDAAERELRALILGESGGLTDKIEGKYAEALNVVAKTAAQIRSDMVYRTALTGMFAEMVGGLSRPWNDESLEARDSAPLDAPAETGDFASQENQAQEDQADDLPQVAQLGSADNY
ncbi:MAG: hypothetical protein LBV79_01825 [Candidatus Adiutrix sp.]|jgi:DNA repair exonuclease SbcCD ATPase subunit|nr:hypothetical protein [Candidatus Adiutrix sp.]